MALELATSFGADQFELVVVGFGVELERFAGVTSTMDVPSLIRRLCHRRITARQALETAGYRSFAEARCVTGAGESEPVAVICGSSIGPGEAAEVLDAGSDPRVGMAVIAVEPNVGSAHRLSYSGRSSSSALALLRSVIFPQTIDADDGAAVTALLDTAASYESVPPSDEPYARLSVPVPGLARDPTETSIRVDRYSTPVRSAVPPLADSQPRAEESGKAGLVTVSVLGSIEVHGADRESRGMGKGTGRLSGDAPERSVQ